MELDTAYGRSYCQTWQSSLWRSTRAMASRGVTSSMAHASGTASPWTAIQLRDHYRALGRRPKIVRRRMRIQWL